MKRPNVSNIHIYCHINLVLSPVDWVPRKEMCNQHWFREWKQTTRLDWFDIFEKFHVYIPNAHIIVLPTIIFVYFCIQVTHPTVICNIKSNHIHLSINVYEWVVILWFWGEIGDWLDLFRMQSEYAMAKWCLGFTRSWLTPPSIDCCDWALCVSSFGNKHQPPSNHQRHCNTVAARMNVNSFIFHMLPPDNGDLIVTEVMAGCFVGAVPCGRIIRSVSAIVLFSGCELFFDLVFLYMSKWLHSSMLEIYFPNFGYYLL